jgi:hypothetical protein
MAFSFRRIGKWAAVLAVVAALCTVAARFGVGRYLASTRGKELVGDRLGSALGMPVEVSEIDVGDSSSSFRFRVMDPADPRAEVFAVRSASADVSAADFMTGRVSPSTLNLDGASLTLRLGSDGQVLTPLPALSGSNGPFPAVAVSDARVCVRREGRPDFAVKGITLRLEPAGEMVNVSGRVSDPRWGEWKVRGQLRRDRRGGWVELSTDDAPLDAATLETLPLVPPGLFEQLKSAGRASVSVRVSVGLDRDLQPVIEIQPRAAAVELPDLGLTLTAITGLIRVSGTRVDVIDLKASVAGGSVTFNGTCPLSDAPPGPDLAADEPGLVVTATGLDVRKLPRAWGLPADEPGTLDGRATLNLSFDRGRIAPHGDGRVTVGDRKFFGVPLGTNFRLYGDGESLRFEPIQ